MKAPKLHSSLMHALCIEGSELMIQHANSDNLDWTWRVRYSNGWTGASVTRTGADLAELLAEFTLADQALTDTEVDLGMIPGRIMDAIRGSSSDFRTVKSLSSELGVREDILRRELLELERSGQVRRPIVAESKYDDWYRDVDRGLTKQEKHARWRAMFTFQPLRDG